MGKFSCIASESINWYNLYGEKFGNSCQNYIYTYSFLKEAILLLGVYPADVCYLLQFASNSKSLQKIQFVSIEDKLKKIIIVDQCMEIQYSNKNIELRSLSVLMGMISKIPCSLKKEGTEYT